MSNNIDNITLKLTENLPLSFSQERLWFIEQLNPGNSGYNIPQIFMIEGNLNLSALQQAIVYIVERHESLRTNFKSKDGKPYAIIQDKIASALKIIKLQHNSNSDQEINRIIKTEISRVFNLEKDLLFKFTLIEISKNKHIFIVIMHHLISDGWSTEILSKELSHLYQVYCQDQEPQLPPLKLQYKDFAIWQREYIEGKALVEKTKFLVEKLKNIPPLSTFTPDYNRPPQQTFRGGKYQQVINNELKNQLNYFCKKERVTFFVVFLTALKILLYRYTLQEKLTIGFPIAGRNKIEIENLIGFFVNTLLIVSDLSNNLSFLELLNQVKESFFQAYENQDVPFEKLVQELQPERNLSYNPLFQILLNVINFESSALSLNDLQVELWKSVDIDTYTDSKFDLTIYIRSSAEGLNLKWVYNRDLFKLETIRAIATHFEAILQGIATNPQQKISDLPRPLLSSNFPNPRQIITATEYELVTNKIAKWAEKTSQNIAVSQDNQTWCYQELWQKANHLAQILRHKGIKQGSAVGISGEKSFGLIISILGVLLSGGIMLTLEPTLPLHRRQLMLKEAKTQLLIFVGTEITDDYLVKETPLSPILVNPKSGNCEYLLTITEKIPELNGKEPAYIFFTSGTTGIPKGVLGSHQGLAHFIDWQQKTFSIQTDDRIAQLTSLSFDVLLRDIFLPLSSGATLCLPPSDWNWDGNTILDWLETEKITVLHTVPTLAQSWLLNIPEKGNLQHLRWIFFAGEPLTGTLVKDWREKFPMAGKIVNLYGPTETTLAKFYYIVPEEVTAETQPVGYPLPETQGLILDKHQALCFIKESGEIVIRTPFRTLGYINNSLETTQKFVTNPYCNQDHDLLYYTGDLGRYRSDGCLEILGRIDDQIKIRGIRIEPQEISSILNQHPSVKESLVIAKERTEGDKCLIAYLIAENPKPIGTELREFLTQKLPEYMIPSAFVFLDKFPLNPNGKIDKKALPEPDFNNQKENEIMAPRNETEIKLVEIWQQVLTRENISINDNFFDLGGHSLLATQIVSRIRTIFQVEFPLRILFQYPTIIQISDYLELYFPGNPQPQWEIMETGEI
jgi:amino acid adenylation domain-containing protein